MDDSKEWQRTLDGQDFVVSTSRDLPHAFVQHAFAQPDMYWATPLPAARLQTMLAHSCTLGLYAVGPGSTRTPIGMARLLTDHATLVYLTDVYLADAYRGRGLGTWMVRCCRDVALALPELRFVMLLTGSEQAQRFYRRELGLEVVGVAEQLVAMGARRPSLQAAAAAEAD